MDAKRKGKGNTSTLQKRKNVMDLSRLFTSKEDETRFLHFFSEKRVIPPKFGKLGSFPSNIFYFSNQLITQGL